MSFPALPQCDDIPADSGTGRRGGWVDLHRPTPHLAHGVDEDILELEIWQDYLEALVIMAIVAND